MPQEQTPGARNLLVKGTYKPGQESTCESVKVKGRILGFCFIIRLRHKGRNPDYSECIKAEGERKRRLTLEKQRLSSANLATSRDGGLLSFLTL